VRFDWNARLKCAITIGRNDESKKKKKKTYADRATSLSPYPKVFVIRIRLPSGAGKGNKTGARFNDQFRPRSSSGVTINSHGNSIKLAVRKWGS